MAKKAGSSWPNTKPGIKDNAITDIVRSMNVPKAAPLAARALLLVVAMPRSLQYHADVEVSCCSQ